MIRLATIFAAILAFVVFAVPAMAQPPEGGDAVCLNVTIMPIGEYSIENFFNDIVIDECEDFDLGYFDLGYIQYNVCTNMPWQLTGHWEYSCDDEPQLPFPQDWMIWKSNGEDQFTQLTLNEEEEVLDKGDCGDFEDLDYFFLLTGPDICDAPGEYHGEIEFHLGPA